MSSNADEKDLARRMGFGPRPRSAFRTDRPASPSSSLFDKLEVRSGMTVSLVGITDPEISSARRDGASRVWPRLVSEPVDVVVFQAESPFALTRVTELAHRVKPGGTLWVLWPRDQGHMTENHVRRSAGFNGLVDVGTVEVTGRLRGMRFVSRHRER